jgi:hypothetical protein
MALTEDQLEFRTRRDETAAGLGATP